MEDRGALFAVAIPLLAFKIWFAILLFVYAPTHDAAVWIAATHWPLLIVFFLLIGPGIAACRLLRARSRRERLRREEWMLSDQRVATEPVRRSR
jgi:multisubunit Na+/H+ antiporter MnhG subunit